MKDLRRLGTLAETPLAIDDETRAASVDAERVREFIISSEAVDSYNTTFRAKGWKLKRYNANPVFLWAHDSSLPPIGRAIKTWVDGDKLRAQIEFAPADLPHPMGLGFGDSVMRMFDLRLLKGTSIRFSPIKWADNAERLDQYGYPGRDFLEQELIESSAVPIPANPEALITAKTRGFDVQPFLAWLETQCSADSQELEGLESIEYCRSCLDSYAHYSAESRIVVPAAVAAEVQNEQATTQEITDAASDAAQDMRALIDQATEEECDKLEAFAATAEELFTLPGLMRSESRDRLEAIASKLSAYLNETQRSEEELEAQDETEHESESQSDTQESEPQVPLRTISMDDIETATKKALARALAAYGVKHHG